MGIPLRQGRLLNAHDIAGAPLVAMINESFARRRLPGLNPIGQRLRIGPNAGPWVTVVGVVGDVKLTSLAVSQADAAYVTAAQWPRTPDNARWLVVRAQSDAAALTPVIRRAIWSVDRNQPILRVATMEERLSASAAQRRFALFLFEAFGVVALVLAAIGTYSLLAGSVAERTVTLLFGISRLDATTYLGVIALLASVSAIACGMPAWRAARIHPSIVLRSE